MACGGCAHSAHVCVSLVTFFVAVVLVQVVAECSQKVLMPADCHCSRFLPLSSCSASAVSAFPNNFISFFRASWTKCQPAIGQTVFLKSLKSFHGSCCARQQQRSSHAAPFAALDAAISTTAATNSEASINPKRPKDRWSEAHTKPGQ